jgi:hypothetical protein
MRKVNWKLTINTMFGPSMMMIVMLSLIQGGIERKEFPQVFYLGLL